MKSGPSFNTFIENTYHTVERVLHAHGFNGQTFGGLYDPFFNAKPCWMREPIFRLWRACFVPYPSLDSAALTGSVHHG